MTCLHCLLNIHEGFNDVGGATISGFYWNMQVMACPACKQPIIEVRRRDSNGATKSFPAYPSKPSFRFVPVEVPNPFKQDFEEAVAVLSLSAKASAALSRRSLQALLCQKAGTTTKDLFDQIEEVISSKTLPSHIGDGLHAVRNIGNFAAHEIKSKATGQIVDVEPGEAEWNLDVLESLFDFYFVEPAKTAKRKADLNTKLKAAGKPELP